MTKNVYVGFASTTPGVAVIDPSSNTVTTNITGTGMGTQPRGVAITPDGTKTYVANLGSGTVSVINNSTNTPKTGTGFPIAVGTGPVGVAITPDGKTVLVANNGTPSISVISTANDTVSSTITANLPNSPTIIAITPDGTTAYVTHQLTPGEISAIDLTVSPPVVKTGTGYPITTNLGNFDTGICITPDGKKAYVANQNSATVSVIDLTLSPPVVKTGTGYPISTGTGTSPMLLAVRPDGTEVYCTNDIPSGTVVVINTTSDSVTNTISVGASPIGVAFSADSTKAYVANNGTNTVSVINTALHTVSSITLASGATPWGVAFQPGSLPLTNIYAAPQGRLTLTSNTPVMTADAIAQTSVYYTPYQGNILPIYDGTNMQSEPPPNEWTPRVSS